MIIDVHAHAHDEAFLFDLSRKPVAGLSTQPDGEGGYVLRRDGQLPLSLDKLLHDLPTRLESLKTRGVDLQLISPNPHLLAWPGGAAGVELSRELNKHTAAIVAQGEGRLGGMAALALGESERAADELLRTVETYGFRAAVTGSSAGGRPLDDPAFEPLIATLERLGLLVFMHSTAAAPNWERFAEYRLAALVAFPFETTLAITRLIFTGVLERHPNLRLVVSHGGGNLPFLRGRLNTAYFATGWEAEPACRANISKPPGDYYQQLYYDTVVNSVESLRFLVDLVGAERVMFGTDYPYEIGDPEGARGLAGIRTLPPADQPKILGENAAAILKSAVTTPTQGGT